ncbi:anti-sigma factor domain-containing protein [Streptomyces sp. NPDC088785]|uniref:anti-sigma factor n=1 Tax=Streptomyces sp. NPDC088785 TaxID=3365897 RepID=UPI003808EDEE
MTTDSTDPHTLTGAYVLDALEDDERAAFEEHLAGCGTCAQEVRELSATAGRLGLAATTAPPDHLKSQVLGMIGEVRQERPQDPPAPVSRKGRGRFGRGTHWALAACVAAIAGLGGTAVWQHQQADDARQEARSAQRQADQVAAVLSAPDAAVTSASLDGGAHGSVVVSRAGGKAVFIASGMAAPPKGKVYQLWFADGGHMRPAGLMNPSRTSQSVLMAGSVDGASGMGVTLEPAGGSRQPTSRPLATMKLPA